MIKKLALIGCLATRAALAAGGEFEVKLSVTEPAGVERKSGPMSGGIPLPRGAFKKGQQFAVFKDGKEIPSQVSPLVVETDGTLRWVLVDFQDDVAAKATNTYVLKAIAPKARPATALVVTDGAGAVTVDTGKMKFTIEKKKPFGLFSSVEAGGKPAVTGGEVSYVQMQGRKKYDDGGKWTPKKIVAGPPDSVKVWYAGPMRVTVEVKGHFAGDPLKAGYKAWITTWAGSRRAWVKYKFCNSNPDQFCVILVNRSTIELNLAGADGQVLLGADKPLTASAGKGGAWLHQGLFPGGKGAAKAGAGSETLWSGPNAGGWISAGGVFVCDRLFSVDPARRLAAEGASLRLEGIAQAFDGKGRPWESKEGRWLTDCTHHSSDYFIDFSAPAEAGELASLAKLVHGRLQVLTSAQYCDALGAGHFGTVDEEKACYERWGWDWKATASSVKLGPTPYCANATRIGAATFVHRVSNHGESEADSTEGTVLMYLRTGDHGWWSIAQAWARYHMDLQALRTDGWKWKDGGCATGSHKGTKPTRKAWNFVWGKCGSGHRMPDVKGKGVDSSCYRDLARGYSSKMCDCHFYGSGLADYYCLTGDRDALEALLDSVETRQSMFQSLSPGTSKVGGGRSFTRAFAVIARTMMVDPDNQYVRKLCKRFARSLWQSPTLDERGANLYPFKRLPTKGGLREAIAKHGLTIGKNGKGRALAISISNPKTGEKWLPKSFGGSWEHVYGQTAADICARYLDDDDMRDYTIAFAKFGAKYLMAKSGQVPYRPHFNVLGPDQLFDLSFEPVKGGYYAGGYTRCYTDVTARAYSWTGEKRLLEKSKTFWQNGACADKKVGIFATHVKSNHDEVLQGSRLFYEWAHPRKDAAPPAEVADLKVTVDGEKARVSFTAPEDQGGGRVVRYQVKCSELPILPYEEWNYVRDSGKKRNWWRAVNLKGEPQPKAPGAKESFTVAGVPAKAKYFAVRSFDDSSNRSTISNLAEARP